ncbi:hypothetical protein [uncultured Brachyspira sp.]|uniref:hypothetical protein n=1 Tax=uncultured Brachyspira sp. TaxID=221953 RepID=UPI00262B6477|nr:hypothetical protein [uncultured Brachyspira sp.]
MKKIFIYIFMAASFSVAYGFDEGFIWALKANFNGSATMPSISDEDLSKIGAGYMKGGVGYTMDGEAELGYLFGSQKWFGGLDPAKFSGMSVFGSIGVGSGFAGQVSGATYEGVTANAYINVSYTPVISFGVGTKAYFLDSRLALGLHIGGKLIADVSPEYLAYFDIDMPGFPEIGEIIVTDFMVKNMNPVMFSIKFMLEYNQPVNDRVEVILGAYTRFNVYSPKYITMPDSLLSLMNSALEKEGKPAFNTTTPLKSYYINSLDFGLTLGLAFKG